MLIANHSGYSRYRMLNKSSCLVVCLVAGIFVLSAVNALTIISVTNGETQGNWGPLEACPDDSPAIGYQTQNDPLNVPIYDKTAMNSIRLFCSDADGTNITSSVGYTGNWQLRQNCPEGEALSAFRLLVVPFDSTAKDNTAANSIQFQCTGGTLLNYNGNFDGQWGDFSANSCNSTGICGIQTRIFPNAGTFTDNTALNDVVFLCC